MKRVKRRVNVRKHKRRLKSGNATIVRRHNRRFNPKLKRPKGFKERKCFKCGQDLSWNELYSTNRNIPWTKLRKLWDSPNVEFYCCSCFWEMNKPRLAEIARNETLNIEAYEERIEFNSPLIYSFFESLKPEEIEQLIQLDYKYFLETGKAIDLLYSIYDDFEANFENPAYYNNKLNLYTIQEEIFGMTQERALCGTLNGILEIVRREKKAELDLLTRELNSYNKWTDDPQLKHLNDKIKESIKILDKLSDNLYEVRDKIFP